MRPTTVVVVGIVLYRSFRLYEEGVTRAPERAFIYYNKHLPEKGYYYYYYCSYARALVWRILFFALVESMPDVILDWLL